MNQSPVVAVRCKACDAELYEQYISYDSEGNPCDLCHECRVAIKMSEGIRYKDYVQEYSEDGAVSESHTVG